MRIPRYRKIYEDELFYGWMLALAAVNGFSHEKYPSGSFANIYFPSSKENTVKETTKPFRLDYPKNLQSLCDYYYKNGYPIPSAAEILKNNTPFGVLAIEKSYGDQAIIARMALTEERQDALRIEKIKSDIVNLCACPICEQEDIEKYGEAYFHVWHQIPGVKVCYRHNEPLLVWKRNYRKDREPVSIEEYNQLTQKEKSEYSDIDIRYAKFVYDQYINQLAISKQEINEILRKKIGVGGHATYKRLSQIAEEMYAQGYGQYFKEDIGKRITKILTDGYSAYEEVVALILYLYGSYEAFFKDTDDAHEINKKKIRAIAAENSTIIGEDGLILSCKCKSCQSKYYIHPFDFEIGFGCPCCDRKLTVDDFVHGQLKKALKDEYELLEPFRGYDKKNKIRHKPCGTIVKKTLKSKIWLGGKCTCQRNKTVDEYRKQLFELTHGQFEVIDIEDKAGGVRKVKVRHIGAAGCGKEFSVGFESFLNNQRCRCCQLKKEAVDSSGLNISRTIAQKIKNCVGDEYTAVKYRGNSKKMVVRHNLCGTETEVVAGSFFSGCRCKLCSGLINHTWLKNKVWECTDGFYEITGFKERETIAIVKFKDGERFSKPVVYIMQELTRPTEPEFFIKRTKKIKYPISPKAELYFEIKDWCKSHKVWIAMDHIGKDDYKSKHNSLHYLKTNGYIQNLYSGVYTINTDVSFTDIVRERYLEDRHGNIMGIYAGDTAAYMCGIISEKPKTFRLYSNAYTGSGYYSCLGEKALVSGIKGAMITNENHEILTGLQLIKYAMTNTECMSSVFDYIKKHTIKKNQMRSYAVIFGSTFEREVIKWLKQF